MMIFLESVYFDFDYQFKIRIKLKNLVMNIQNFQLFFSNFLRLNVSIKYNDDTKFEKLHDKLFIEFKNALNNNFRKFIFLVEIRIEFTKIYNSRTRMKKQRIEK